MAFSQEPGKNRFATPVAKPGRKVTGLGRDGRAASDERHGETSYPWGDARETSNPQKTVGRPGETHEANIETISGSGSAVNGCNFGASGAERAGRQQPSG